MSHFLVILNPAAGTASTQLENLREMARHHGANVLGPRDSDALSRYLHAALDRGTRRFVVAGGDGSVARLVNALATRLAEIEVGIVPMGTGNDLARSLDLPLNDLHRAFELAATGPTSPIDLIHVENGRNCYVVNAATAGFGAEVTAAVTAGDKQMWGAFAYWLTATRQLANRHPFTVELQVDQETLRTTCYGLTLANGHYIGGAFPVAGRAFLDDGQLDLVVIPELSTVELLAAGTNYLAGWAPDSSSILVRQASTVVVKATPCLPFSLDGDPVSPFDAKFAIAPRTLRIVAGPNAALQSSFNPQP